MTVEFEKSLELFKKDQGEILKNCIDEVRHNTRFSSEQLRQSPALEAHSKRFFNHVLDTVQRDELPDLSKTNIQPILKLWHDVL